ncbi:laminaripentaose-producing beta-13-glucanase [Fusarium albosuccineum]|uniref:Laminaripentaose-producing beta-13-glucanase n=1 Tax=Fusarium albosuccineum TaxID=1237068 RepID=A0A8H4P8X3_9HYPO|nr:laminaripentaose-producing beta-13-glucanase [Fusarium albosuccineum]
MRKIGTAHTFPFQPSSIIKDRGITSEGFIKASPGNVKEVEVNVDDILGGIYSKNKTQVLFHRAAESANLPIKIANKSFRGKIKAYILGLDSDAAVVFVGADGNLVYPRSGGSLLPVEITENIAILLPSQGETLNFTQPVSLSSGRV